MNVEIQCFAKFEVIAILALSQKVNKRVSYRRVFVYVLTYIGFICQFSSKYRMCLRCMTCNYEIELPQDYNSILEVMSILNFFCLLSCKIN